MRSNRRYDPRRRELSRAGNVRLLGHCSREMLTASLSGFDPELPSEVQLFCAAIFSIRSPRPLAQAVSAARQYPKAGAVCILMTSSNFVAAVSRFFTFEDARSIRAKLAILLLEWRSKLTRCAQRRSQFRHTLSLGGG